MAESVNQQTILPEGKTETDILDLAKQEREKQGPMEAEFSCGGEADLHRHLKNCNKNPGHLNFVPIDKFKIKSLPSGYRSYHLVNFVRAVSDLTVRVSVNYVSENRPETIPDSDKPYPCYSQRGTNMMRVGTGWVYFINKHTNNSRQKETCKCKECLNSPTPKTEFAKIWIRTATHVVYNKEEGEHTTCHLFFDRGGTPESCSGVVTLSGMSDVAGRAPIDYCDMMYSTHDQDLIDKVDKMLEYCEFCRHALQTRNRSDMPSRIVPLYQEEHVPDASSSQLTFIVSHPHGCSKQVSVGHCTNSKERVDDNDKFVYTTATCPGSSGAFVYVLGTNLTFMHMYRQVHSGNFQENKALNFSGLGYGYLAGN